MSFLRPLSTKLALACRRHSNNHHVNSFIIGCRQHQRRLFSANSSGNQSKCSSPPPSNMTIRYATTKHNIDNIDSPASTSSIEQQLASLQAEIAHLSYLIKQTATQQIETAAISRRAEARAYIIEHKLMDIQSHVVKIPALENMAKSFRQYLKDYSPSVVSAALFQRATTGEGGGGRGLLLNKYTFWISLSSLLIFWQYRVTMYRRTSEEIADVASMTLQQDTLRKTIQETLSTVANSPSTLASLSLLFQQLISEEKTQQHLVDLIVRALGSEGVRLAAISLLDICFQNGELQGRAGQFLKIAAKATVLDESVQMSAGMGIQQALKSAVLPPWWVKSLNKDGRRSSVDGRRRLADDDHVNVSEKNDDDETENDDSVDALVQ